MSVRVFSYDPMELTIVAQRSDLPDFQQPLQDFCDAADLSEIERHRLNLVLEELVSNTIQHGFAGAVGHTLHMTLGRKVDEIHVTVTDDGPPFNPFEPVGKIAELSLEERAIGGLGLHLINAVATRTCYHWDGRRNIVGFVILLADPAASG